MSTPLIEWELRVTTWVGLTRPEAFQALGLRPVPERWVIKKNERGVWELSGTYRWHGGLKVERTFLKELQTEAERMARGRMAARVAKVKQ